MASTTIPSEPPPPYTPSNPSSSTAPQSSQAQDTSHLQVPHKTRSGIPPNVRRSMEDESRELPPGWVRQYDSSSHHQFFVDERANPPRSIWHHPYDDSTYLSTLPSSERERIKNLHHPMPNRADIEAESSGDDEHEHHGAGQGDEQLSGTKKFGRKMKDKLTGSTHEEREASRRKREEEERKMYAQHQHIRRQMSLAAETGQPQLLGKDANGKEVYIEPPSDPYGGGYGGGLGGGFGGGFGGYSGGRGYGYNPYSSGMYGNPNARYIRPQQPYGRPYGMGYGGGYGLPIGLGLGGGLLMGGLLF